MVSTAYRQRFRLAHDPLPRDACGKTCFLRDDDDTARIRRLFGWLAAEPGLGLLTGDAGTGKTTLMRHLCSELPAPEHKVLYLCDTAVTATSVYRNLAAALGLEPCFRRDALWRQLKTTIARLVDREAVVPILIIDEAQRLSDDFLLDFSSFLNHAFDSRDLLTVWLVGLPSLRTRLDLRVHAALRTRIISPNTLAPRNREQLFAMVRHGLVTAGAKASIIAEPALEVLYRVSRGLPREASKLLRMGLSIAHERAQDFIDEHTMLDACDALDLRRPSAPVTPKTAKSRSKRATKSR